MQKDWQKEEEIRLDLNAFSNGVYFIKLITGNTFQTEKILFNPS